MPESPSQNENEPNALKTIKKYDIFLTNAELNKPRPDMAALAYIAGYCAHAALERQPCDDYRDILTVTERELQNSDYVLIDSISQGGLKLSRRAVIHAVLCRFFGVVRSFHGDDDHPTIVQFGQVYRLLSLFTPVKKAVKGNCSSQADTVLVSLHESLGKKKQRQLPKPNVLLRQSSTRSSLASLLLRVTVMN
ncbi:hypothetical protein MRX96_049415 [Rhipicephalus microplus]